MILKESKEDLTFEEINVLTTKVGWGKCYYQTREKWQRVLSLCSHIAYIKVNEELIAFGRIVEDGVMCMFYDICVHPDHQGKGVGTLLMNHLISKIKANEYVSVGLFTWEGNKTVAEFYSKLGFQKASAMQLSK